MAGSLATLRPLLRACMVRVRSLASEAQSVCRRHGQYNSSNIISHDIISDNNTYQTKCAKASYDDRGRSSVGPGRLNPLRSGCGRKASDITATTTITTTYNKNSNRNSYNSYNIYDICEKSPSSLGRVSENSGSSPTRSGGNVVVQPSLYQYPLQQQQQQQRYLHQHQHQQWYHERHYSGSNRSSSSSSKKHTANDLTNVHEQDHYDNYIHDGPNWPIRSDTSIYKETNVNFGGEDV